MADRPSPERAVAWDACLNARDLGGLPAAGGTIARGSLIRSDALYRLTEAGRAALVAQGVRTVLDMRTAEEVAARPDPFDGDPGVVYLHIAQQTAETWKAIGPGVDRVTFDTTALELCGPRLAAIVEAIADAPPGAVAFHCEAGKDRTGLMTMLLLDLVGTPREEIAADYALTGPALTSLFEELLAKAKTPERRARLEEEARCSPEVSLAIQTTLHRRYGGAESYLRAAGASASAIERVRARMFE